METASEKAQVAANVETVDTHDQYRRKLSDEVLFLIKNLKALIDRNGDLFLKASTSTSESLTFEEVASINRFLFDNGFMTRENEQQIKNIAQLLTALEELLAALSPVYNIRDREKAKIAEVV